MPRFSLKVLPLSNPYSCAITTSAAAFIQLHTFIKIPVALFNQIHNDAYPFNVHSDKCTQDSGHFNFSHGFKRKQPG